MKNLYQSSGKGDPLALILAKVEAFARDRGIRLLSGHVHPAESPSYPEIVFENENDLESLDAFFAECEAAGTRRLVVDAVALNHEALRGAEGFVRDWLEESDETEALIREIRGLDSMIGRLAQLRMSFFENSPPLMLTLSFEAPWFDLVYDIEAHAEALGLLTRDEDEEDEERD